MHIAQASSEYTYRIPSLIDVHDSLICFFEQRPQPALNTQLHGALPDDLPNANQPMFAQSFDGGNSWSVAQNIIGLDSHTGDIAALSYEDQLLFTYASSNKVGYFTADKNEPLHICAASGSNIHQLRILNWDEVYKLIDCDALFITSGHACFWDGLARFAAVVRRGQDAWIQVISATMDGKIMYVSEEIRSSWPLDECAIASFNEQLILNCRLQNSPGRISFTSCDGLHFREDVDLFAQLRPEHMEWDAQHAGPLGCNGSLLHVGKNLYLSLPKNIVERQGGCIYTHDGQTVDLGIDGSFAYSDLQYFNNSLVIAYESDGDICIKRIPVTCDE